MAKCKALTGPAVKGLMTLAVPELEKAHPTFVTLCTICAVLDAMPTHGSVAHSAAQTDCTDGHHLSIQ